MRCFWGKGSPAPRIWMASHDHHVVAGASRLSKTTGWVAADQPSICPQLQQRIASLASRSRLFGSSLGRGFLHWRTDVPTAMVIDHQIAACGARDPSHRYGTGEHAWQLGRQRQRESFRFSNILSATPLPFAFPVVGVHDVCHSDRFGRATVQIVRFLLPKVTRLDPSHNIDSIRRTTSTRSVAQHRLDPSHNKTTV